MQAGPGAVNAPKTRAAVQQLSNRSGWYDGLYARMINSQTGTYNKLLDARKRQLFTHVADNAAVQDVLEIGMGSGANLPFYAPQRKVCACCCCQMARSTRRTSAHQQAPAAGAQPRATWRVTCGAAAPARPCPPPAAPPHHTHRAQDLRITAVDPNAKMLPYLQDT
jgi:hypothetical protein